MLQIDKACFKHFNKTKINVLINLCQSLTFLSHSLNFNKFKKICFNLSKCNTMILREKNLLPNKCNHHNKTYLTLLI